MRNRLSPGNTVHCGRALTQGRGGYGAGSDHLLNEEEEGEGPLMSGPDWLTEDKSVYVQKVATN